MKSHSNKLYLTWSDIYKRVETLRFNLMRKYYNSKNGAVKLYGIPRGGSIVVGFLCNNFYRFEIVNNPKEADVLIDDIFDSGQTFNKYTKKYKKPIEVLVSKAFEFENEWVVFPWEETDSNKDIDDHIIRICEYYSINQESLKEYIKCMVKELK